MLRILLKKGYQMKYSKKLIVLYCLSFTGLKLFWISRRFLLSIAFACQFLGKIDSVEKLLPFSMYLILFFAAKWWIDAKKIWSWGTSWFATPAFKYDSCKFLISSQSTTCVYKSNLQIIWYLEFLQHLRVWYWMKSWNFLLRNWHMR